MKKSLRRNRGFTLFEMLTYLALLGMVSSIITSIYYQFSRTLPAAERTLLRERGAYHVVQRMQDDIRQSSGIQDSFGPLAADSRCLILKDGRDGDPGDSVIIYKFVKTKKALMRYQVVAERSSQSVYSLKLGYDIETFKFAADKEKPNLVKVSIGVKKGPYGLLRNRPLTFYTMMRN